jgi:hypothetical protein
MAEARMVWVVHVTDKLNLAHRHRALPLALDLQDARRGDRWRKEEGGFTV